MSASGAKVMALRSIEVARSYGVKLQVPLDVRRRRGHLDRRGGGRLLEKAIISGVTHDTSEAKVVLIGVPDRPGVAARVFRALADAGVNVDMIVQNVSETGRPTSRSRCPKTDVRVADPMLEEAGARDRRDAASSATPTSRRSR